MDSIIDNGQLQKWKWEKWTRYASGTIPHTGDTIFFEVNGCEYSRIITCDGRVLFRQLGQIDAVQAWNSFMKTGFHSMSMMNLYSFLFSEKTEDPGEMEGAQRILDGFIEVWHGESVPVGTTLEVHDMTLAEFLGLTDEEYSEFVEKGPKHLYEIVKARKEKKNEK